MNVEFLGSWQGDIVDQMQKIDPSLVNVNSDVVDNMQKAWAGIVAGNPPTMVGNLFSDGHATMDLLSKATHQDLPTTRAFMVALIKFGTDGTIDQSLYNSSLSPTGGKSLIDSVEETVQNAASSVGQGISSAASTVTDVAASAAKGVQGVAVIAGLGVAAVLLIMAMRFLPKGGK